MRWFCWTLFITLQLTVNIAQADVVGMRLSKTDEHTRLVFDLSKPLEHKLFALSNPHRLVIDIKKASLKGKIDNNQFSNTAIDKLRSAPRNQSDLRIVLDLSRELHPRSFVLKKQGDAKDRLVIDLFDQAKQTVKSSKPPASKTSPNKGRDIIIAIDPGHGGDDPGAIGPRKVREKDIVLSISKRLAAEINAIKGFKAVLTRNTDRYIPLRTRTKIAHQKRADLLVSIHADAFKNTKAKGASVFALSQRGATSETARYLASRENRDLYGDVSIGDKDKVLAEVLLDLSMTATLNASLQVGGLVLNQMGSKTALHKSHVEQAGFVVLKSPDIPSILVETGFISNPSEAKLLKSSGHQKKLAKAIRKGIIHYFKSFPPPDSQLALASQQ